jgi:hypothetical protein
MVSRAWEVHGACMVSGKYMATYAALFIEPIYLKVLLSERGVY